jgi:diaminobutyrate-2-oxoglutarate transaminase
MFPGPTGTNAVEAALKLARKVKGRESIVSFTNAFHGMSLGSLAVTGNAFKRAGAGIPLVHGTPMPFDNYFEGTVEDFLWFERLLEDQGSGPQQARRGHRGDRAGRGRHQRGASGVAARARPSCASGRTCCSSSTTSRWAADGPVPSSRSRRRASPPTSSPSPSPSAATDMPMSLCLFKPELDIWEPGEHNGTFRGNNPAFVTATATLEAYWADGSVMEKQTRARGEQVEQAFISITEENLTDVKEYRGRGPRVGPGVPRQGARRTESRSAPSNSACSSRRRARRARS